MSEQEARTSNPTIDPLSYNAGIEAAAKWHDEQAITCGHRLGELDRYRDSQPWREWKRNQDAHGYYARSIRSLHRTEPQTAPDTDHERNAAAWHRCAETIMTMAGLSCSGNPSEMMSEFQAWLALQATSAPADAERLALAAKLRVAAKIAGNPVHDDIMRAAEYLEKLRAGGWRGATCKELLQVPESSSPHTDKEG